MFRDNGVDVATYELCLFAELRDRLRAGDIWVVGSGQYRALEDQLIPKVNPISARKQVLASKNS